MWRLIDDDVLSEEIYSCVKANMIAMLTELKSEMNSIKECERQIYGKEKWNFVGKCQDVVQQKIEQLKENKDNYGNDD